MNSAITMVDQRLDEIRDGILFHLKRQGEDMLIIGKLATEAKELMPHGQYTTWIREALGVSPELIRGYRRVYERFGSKTVNFTVLPLSAWLLLASPSVPEGAVSEVEILLERGERFTVDGVEELISRHKTNEGAHIATTAILETFGTRSDGTPADSIPRSVVTSLQKVTGDVVERGVVEIDGKDYPISKPLPQPVVIATQAETNRRRAEHIQDNMPAVEIVVDNVRVPVAAMIINDCVTFRIPGIGAKLVQGEIVRVKIVREIVS